VSGCRRNRRPDKPEYATSKVVAVLMEFICYFLNLRELIFGTDDYTDEHGIYTMVKLSGNNYGN
jgi:hypothetical protein